MRLVLFWASLALAALFSGVFVWAIVDGNIIAVVCEGVAAIMEFTFAAYWRIEYNKYGA
jgi:hypothetical protein